MGASENDLLPVMNRLCAEFDDLKFFSLPTIQGPSRLIEIGFKGRAHRVAQALTALQIALDGLNVVYQADRPQVTQPSR